MKKRVIALTLSTDNDAAFIPLSAVPQKRQQQLQQQIQLQQQKKNPLQQRVQQLSQRKQQAANWLWQPTLSSHHTSSMTETRS